MAEILILYSTTDGQTRKICERLKQVIEADRHRVSLVSLEDQPAFDIAPFDKVVIGARIRYGKHSKQVYRFIDRNRWLLGSKPGALFSVNVVARKPGKDTPETNPYMRKLAARIAWRPQLLGVFAGRIEYRRYSFWDRQIIRFIMWLTKGPTDPDTAVEFTRWDEVEAFGRRISHL
jgi:menaquinone-dependent protoporphyrinogen oxidase